jgi:DNA polymerase
VVLLDAALNIAEESATDLRDRLAALTDGEITSPSQTARIVKWLAGQGCEVPNVQEETLLEALKRSDLAPTARKLIGLRLDGAHAAVNKLATLRRWLGPDHRIRQVFRFHGASSGRFTSVGAQGGLRKPVDASAGSGSPRVPARWHPYAKIRSRQGAHLDRSS